jgi:hypothetical protein
MKVSRFYFVYKEMNRFKPKQTYEPLTIKEPYKVEIKKFEDSDEFTRYYREHEDDFKGLSTLKLNRTYKIPGYRISVKNRGKEDEELILKKDYYGGCNKDETVEENEPRVDALDVELLHMLAKRVENIERFLADN